MFKGLHFPSNSKCNYFYLYISQHVVRIYLEQKQAMASSAPQQLVSRGHVCTTCYVYSLSMCNLIAKHTVPDHFS
jgi:hypothetical protein